MGTSYYAALVGKFLLEKYLKIPVEVDNASEFRYRNPIVDKNTLTVVVSPKRRDSGYPDGSSRSQIPRFQSDRHL